MSSSPSVISYKHQLKVPKDNRSYSCSSYISSSPSLPFINLTFSRKLSSSPPKLSSSKPPSAPSSLVTGKTSQAKLSKPLQALRYKARPVTRKKPGGKDEWSVVAYSAAESLDLLGLQDAIRNQELYTQVPISEELESSCLFVSNKIGGAGS